MVHVVTTATSHQPRTKRLVSALAALLACAGLTACQDETDIKASPATASASAAVPAGLESFYNQKVSWYACAKTGMAKAKSGQDTGFTCAKVKVPLDYDNPGGKTIEIAVKKRAASEDSVGSLFVNPGGPGGSGIELVDGVGSYFSKNLTNSYDVVGFDPRGVGASTAVDCLTDAELDAERAGANDPATPSATATQERAQKMNASCESKTSTSGLLDHIDTISAAKDLDILRAVDGQQALTYLGFSYGTYLGATYAELFPANTGRLVLDGAVDPTLGAEELAMGQAKGFEASLRAYVQSCQSSKVGCPLSGDVDSGVSQIREFLESTKTAPLPTSDDKRPLTYDLAVYGVLGSMYQTQLWPTLNLGLSQAMGKMGKPDGSTLLTIADTISSRKGDGSYSNNGTEALMAVNCLDYPVQGDNASWEENAKAVKEASPTFSSQLLYPDAYCQGWGHTSSRKREKITASGAAPILVVGTTGDPATPYAWSQALADQLESGQLLTWKGDGHTAYGRSNDCVKKAVDTYLLNGTMPDKGLTC
ncbi:MULTISPECIES: alpha/beta hydrolase [Actinomyces]|uniref:Alpha/beta hydrolase n=1 Tax=Actinomyces oris TaxID=544580 RepID=A0A1Q8VMT4_9ACTO|nr:alpha/beta hydrolase [Actinomyces oris]OLO49389.1 alpha/beta hydrolase [Actinomyces oris]